jgi:hypothetical protein
MNGEVNRIVCGWALPVPSVAARDGERRDLSGGNDIFRKKRFARVIGKIAAHNDAILITLVVAVRGRFWGGRMERSCNGGGHGGGVPQRFPPTA